MKLIKLSAILLALAAMPSRADYSAWKLSSTVTVNTSSTGAKLHNPVYKFPVLVRLTPANRDVFANSKPGGADLRFTKADGVTPLAHQIERWDRDKQLAEIWVRVDTVPALDEVNIRMLWNNPDAEVDSSASGVFKSDNGFKDAWHLGNAAGNALPRPSSVSSGGVAASPKGVNSATIAIKTVEGVVGLADSLRGNGRGTGLIGDHFTLGDAYQVTSYVTIAMWVKPSSSRRAHFFDIGDPNGSGSENDVWLGQDSNRTLASQVDGNLNKSSANLMTVNDWQHIAFVAKGSDSAHLYRNGVRVKSFPGTGPSSHYRTKAYLGRSGWIADSTFGGVLDEVSVSSINRDSNWIKLAYETQKPGLNAVTISSSGAHQLAVTSQSILLTGADIPGYDAGSIYQGTLALHNGNGLAYTVVERNEGEIVTTRDAGFNPEGFTLGIQGAGFESASRVNIKPYRLSVIGDWGIPSQHSTEITPSSVSTSYVDAEQLTATRVQAYEVVVTPKWESWPDYVFEEGHERASLSDLETFVRANKHLPGMPSAQDVARNGVGLADMNMRLLKTVEELTLHIIDLEKKLQGLAAKP